MKLSIFLPVAAMAGLFSMHAADWLTFGHDAQRTGWARDESDLGKDSVKNLTLAWKIQLENQSKELNSLSAPLVIEKVITNKGFKDYVVVAGASDTLFAVDADNGKLAWKKAFQAEGKPSRAPHWLCPNSLNATPVLNSGGTFGKTAYVIASDGKLHVLNVVNGEDRMAPVQFVPPFSKNWSLNLFNNTLYTTISQGCNGAKSGIYSMDLTTPDHKITFFQSTTGGGGIWGRGGAAISPDGEVYAETGDGTYDAAAGKFSDTVVGVSGKDLKLADYFTPGNHVYISHKDLDMGNMSPVVFKYKNWELVAAAGKEGVIYLLDAKNLGGADHRTPLFRSPLYTNDDVDFAGRGFWGAFATWEDADGVRWLLAPAWGPAGTTAPKFPMTNGPAPNGSIMAFKVEEKDGKPVLTPAWMSRDMNMAEPPIVSNGVVYAVSSGENTRQVDSDGKILTSPQRATTPVGNAVLYAFDAATGKELFSSAKTMPGFTHFSGIALASGRVFVSTYDNVLYAFGLKQ